VGVWGKKTGVGIGHNARSKACPALKRSCRRAPPVAVKPRAIVLPKKESAEESVLSQRLIMSQVELKQEKLDHEITKQELASKRGEESEVSVGEEGKCSVCMERRKTHAFYPCMHQCVCGVCALQIENTKPARCPICRANVMGSGKVHVV
tara:strand:+ start:191 stop:640 length:450 start_codon:yes stop_codon:yes gene_type:complete